MGDQEIGVVSGRLLENPGELDRGNACKNRKGLGQVMNCWFVSYLREGLTRPDD